MKKIFLSSVILLVLAVAGFNAFANFGSSPKQEGVTSATDEECVTNGPTMLQVLTAAIEQQVVPQGSTAFEMTSYEYEKSGEFSGEIWITDPNNNSGVYAWRTDKYCMFCWCCLDDSYIIAPN